MQNTNKQICHYFNTRYGCKYGINCQYSHQPIPREGSELIDKGGTTTKSNHDILSRKQQHRISVTRQVSDYSTQGYQHEESTVQQRLICHYFRTFGSCKFGRHCQFKHISPNYGPRFGAADKLSASSGIQGDELNVRNQTKDFVRKPAKCRFFLSGNCRFGENCKFSHPNARVRDHTKNESDLTSVSQAKSVFTPDRPISSGASDSNSHGQHYRDTNDAQGAPRVPRYVPRQSQPKIDKSNVTEDEIKKFRTSECERIKRRFTKHLLEVLSESEDVSEYQFKVQPTDPDWPFDIKSFDFVISIPKDYPATLFSVSVPSDQDLPETVRRFIEVSVDEWIQEKRNNTAVELLFLPLLRWIDRNLEEIVTSGLRQLKRELVAQSAGFQFIPAADLVKARTANTSSVNDDKSEVKEEENGESDEVSEDDSYEANKENLDEVGESGGQDSSKASHDNDARRGTEVLLRNLQLVGNAATLLLPKAYFIVQCARCKHRSEFSTPAGRQNQVICGKCNNVQLITFRAVLAHQFSAVVGYLDLDGCTAFDLILHESSVTLGCLNCSKETRIEGIQPGAGRDIWCQSCHQKMRVVTENARFQQLQPTLITTDDQQAFNIPVKMLKKVPKDPSIQEGRPLPDVGTCKHFKKSFRWLRFPCCGKAYPCDICHDENETDHEMKFANRMICGYCCKEQPYAAERPCTACNSSLTKGHTMHWEGGRGCRDKIRMSRNDTQKYANLHKTVSRKAKDKNEPKSKKKEKA